MNEEGQFDAVDKATRQVSIDVAEYKVLLQRSEFLGCLEDAGVDNWDGYDQACDEFQQ